MIDPAKLRRAIAAAHAIIGKRNHLVILAVDMETSTKVDDRYEVEVQHATSTTLLTAVKICGLWARQHED